MLRTIFAVFSFILLNFAVAMAQDSAQTSPNLETILSEAQKQTEFYKETFRNLLAEETKVFEEFDKDGNSDGRTAVKSIFLVYQSGRNANVTTELRNVVEVNGKLVPNSQKRSDDFLAELEKTTTLEKELNKIQREGAKYDKTIEVYGLTLNEAVVLSPNIRPFFEFKLLGRENYQGNDVYIISYQQTRKSPYIVINGKDSVSNEAGLNFKFDIPGSLKNNDNFLRGKLWIDAKDFQLRREEQELTVNSPAPLTLLTAGFEYQPSNYGILVPKTISLTTFELKKQKRDGNFISIKDTSVNFDYSKFRQTNVEVQILDDK